jgi:hypothetical protein
MADAFSSTMLAQPFELLSEPHVPRTERRAEIRHRVDLACVVRRKHWRLTRARVIDLSADGMLLAFEGWIEDGVELHVSFKAAEPAIWFDTLATVTRVVHGRRAHDARRAVGLRFESLSAVARVILRGHLRCFPRPAPQREPPRALAAKSEDYASIVRSLLLTQEFRSPEPSRPG